MDVTVTNIAGTSATSAADLFSYITAPAFTSAASTEFSVGSAGSFTVTTSGVPTVSSITNADFGACTASALPGGVTFHDNGDGTATIAGTPAPGTTGTYTLCLTATNGIAPDPTQTFTLTVNKAPAITSTDHATFAVGSAGSFTVTTTGVPAVSAIANADFGVCTASALPGGVTFHDNGDGTATISGTPATGTGGTYTLCLTATNGIAPDATQTFTLTVNQAPAITSTDHATFTVGGSGSFTVTATGYPTPAFSETGPLPSGVTLLANGTLSGTPATGTAGSYPITITASNGVLPDDHQSFTLTVSGVADHFVLSAATTTPTAGDADNLTITAKDSSNITATGYTGDKSLTFSGASSIGSFDPTVTDKTGAAVNFGTAETITFVDGVATVSAGANGAMKLYKAETASITVTDGSISNAGLTVTVTPAGAVSLSVSGYPSPTVAGKSHSFTVTALDAFGNTATGYTGTVHFTNTNDAAAVLPSNYAFVGGDAGSKSFSATFKTVAGGTKALTVTDTVTGSITGFQAPITVTAAGAASLSVSGYPSPTVAGVSHSFTVTALDAFGNTATGYTGTVHFTNTNDAAAVLPSNYAFVGGDAGSKSFSATFKTVAGGTKALTVTDTVTGSITGFQAPITVTAAGAASLSVSGYPSPTVAGVSHSFTVTALDAFGNTATGYTGTVHFTNTNDAAAVLPSNYAFVGGDAGSKSFSATFKTVAGGTKALTVTDTVTGSITGFQAPITVTAAGAASLSVSGYPSPTVAGVSHSFTVTALDAFGNTATGYTGTVHFTNTNDAAAVLPSNYAFVGGDAGSKSFSATFKTVAGGTKALTVTDTVTGSITGFQAPITVTAAGAASLSVSGYPSPTVAGVSHSFTVTALDAFGNTATGYTGTVHFTNTNDAAAVLPSNYAFVGGDAGSKSFSATFKTVAGGTKALTATDTVTGSITGSQTPITVTPAAATVLTKTAGDNQSTATGTAFGTALSGTVTDAYGNPVSGVPVTFTAPAGGSGTPVAGSQSFSGTSDSSAAVGLTTVQSASDGEVIFLANDGTSGTFSSSQGAITELSHDSHSSGSMALFAGSPPQTSESLSWSGSHNWGAIGVETSASSAALVAESTHNASGPISTSVTLTSGHSYLVFASNLASSSSMTPSVSGWSGTAPTFTQIGSTQSFNGSNGYAAAWYLTGGSGSGTINVSYSGNDRAYIEVVELPAVAGGASGTFSGSCTGTTCVATSNASGIATVSTFTANSTGGSYNVSASGPSTNTVDFALSNMATTTTVVSSSANPSTSGQSVTLTATVAPTSGGGAPTGTVNFKDGGTTISGCGLQTVGGSGPYTATCTTSALSVGSHTITGIYSGDTSFLTSTSDDFTQTVILIDASQISAASNTATGSSSITSNTFTTAETGSTVLVLVTYEDGRDRTCSSAANSSGSPLASLSLIANNNYWYRSGGSSNHHYYGMCAFSAKGNHTSGTVTVTLSGSGTTDYLAIQVIEITGDTSATIGINGSNHGGSDRYPSFDFGGALSAGSFEIAFGDAAGAPTWSTAPSNFTQVGSTQNGGGSGYTYSSAVYFGPSTSSTTATLDSSSYWGTQAIEIKP